jgi:predicted transcriptional regulator
VGCRGKVEEQEKARLLRAENRTLQEIAEILGVSKSSVSLWVRDVPAEIIRRYPLTRRPHGQQVERLAEIAACDASGRQRLADLSDEAFLAAGIALYAGEGAKTDGKVLFANTNAEMVAFFCRWLRHFFKIDESRMRARVYLHEGLDLEAAEDYWSGITSVARMQFRAPYRAKPDPSIRHAKHQFGCVYVYYCCSRTHREVMGLVRALLASSAIPG